MRIDSSEMCRLQVSRSPAALASATSSLGTLLNKNLIGARNALVAISLGAMTSAVLSAGVYECATSGGTYTLVSGSAFSVTAASQNKIFVGSVNLEGRLQFLKIRHRAGTGGAPIVGSSWLLCNPPALAISQENTVKFQV